MEPSIITPPLSRGHSAQVETTLIVGDVSHLVRLLGPDYVFLEKAGNHAATEADLIVEIDGTRECSRVFLPNGLKPGEREIRFKRLR